jgi:hypothetical protein
VLDVPVESTQAVSTEGVMETRGARKGENEARFRLVNEGVARTDAILTPHASQLDLFCECSRAECTTLVTLSRVEYERVREVSTHFIVAHGHVDSQVEVVVEEAAGYVVVRKREGDAADVARATDPRR